jgi:hypothetical protein
MKSIWKAVSLALAAIAAGCADSCEETVGPDDDPQQLVRVVVTGNGAGSGQVTATNQVFPIDCHIAAGVASPANTCDVQVDTANASLTLQAIPDAGSAFESWSCSRTEVFGDCTPCPATGNCRVSWTVGVVPLRFSIRATFRVVDPDEVAVFADDFDDGFGALARWQAVQRASTGGAGHTVSNPLTGGIPLTGGYRSGQHTFPAPGQISVTHIYLGDATHPGVYDPAVSGPVDSLVATMDVIALSGNIGAAFQVRQGAGYYFASMHPGDAFQNAAWVRVRKKLAASDFLQAPDFTQPMEFGFLRSNTTAGSGVSTTWGTDNFRVEVWHH